LVERLPAFTSNRTTRLVKSPKLYWTDPGLEAFLAGYYDRDSLPKGREAGAFFESLILHYLKVLAQLLTPHGLLFYWRTTTGHEVDFVLEQGRRLLSFEVKLISSPRFGDADGLRLFLSENQAVGGVLLHGGQEIKRLDEHIVALPWTMLTG